MWRQKLAKLEEQHAEAIKRKGEAAAMGDLSENAAYSMAVEDAGMYQARIIEVKKIIAKLEEEGAVGKTA